MLSHSTQKYIKKRIKRIQYQARKNGYILNIPNNYMTILEPYYQMVCKNGYVLEFSDKGGMHKRGLNAHAGISREKRSAITATPEWAVQLIVCNNSETDSAFRITLGHELTHKDPEVWMLGRLSDLKLLQYLRELHADFGAAKKMANSSRVVLIQSCEYKKHFKEKVRRMKDRNTLCHPSWTKRIEYATYYEFNECLIKKVANDLGYNENKKRHKDLINKIVDAYSDKFVTLYPPITTEK